MTKEEKWQGKLRNYVIDEFGLPVFGPGQKTPAWIIKRRNFLKKLPVDVRNTILTGDPAFAFDPLVYHTVLYQTQVPPALQPLQQQVLQPAGQAAHPLPQPAQVQPENQPLPYSESDTESEEGLYQSFDTAYEGEEDDQAEDLGEEEEEEDEEDPNVTIIQRATLERGLPKQSSSSSSDERPPKKTVRRLQPPPAGAAAANLPRRSQGGWLTRMFDLVPPLPGMSGEVPSPARGTRSKVKIAEEPWKFHDGSSRKRHHPH